MVSVATFVTALAGGALLSGVVTAESEWGCPSEQIGTAIYTLAEEGGHKTPDDAIVGQLVTLSGDGLLSREKYLTALPSSSGESRYDASTGRLYVEGVLHAEMVLTQIPDGSWGVQTLTYCMRPPTAKEASPFPTPSIATGPS